MKTYKAYRFTGKDPVIDELKKLTERSLGDASSRSLRTVSNSGGPATSTMNAWYRGKTMRPNNSTIEAAGRALGFKRVWVKKKD